MTTLAGSHTSPVPVTTAELTHLQRLEAESIHIMREVVAECERPVMLYSIGKDSSVMLHLALKAFYPAKPPFPFLHVDTTWKFREMIAFRDETARAARASNLLVHINREGLEMGINPFSAWVGAAHRHHEDAGAPAGARSLSLRRRVRRRPTRRGEIARQGAHLLDPIARSTAGIPKQQRPELWRLYNARMRKGESIRVFPLSNWTELDVWQYIYLENIPIVPLYFSRERPVVVRDGTLIMVDDDRMPLEPGETPALRRVRFRTLGCYPLTGAIESDADTLPAIIQEMLLTRHSERQGRVIDHDQSASMEKKKVEGYF